MFQRFNMNRINIYIIILLLMELFISCSKAPAEPDLPDGVAVSGDEGLIYLTIEDEATIDTV